MFGLFGKQKRRRANPPTASTIIGQAAGGIWVDESGDGLRKRKHYSFSLRRCIQDKYGHESYYRSLPLRQFENAILAMSWVADWFSKQEDLPKALRDEMVRYCTTLDSLVPQDDV